MGDAEGEVGVLLDEQDGQTALFVDGDDLIKNGTHKNRRNAEGWLVEHEAARLTHQGAGDGEHLLLTSGHGARGLMDALLQPWKNGEGIVHVLGNTRLVAAQVGSHLQIFDHGQIGKNHAPLRHMTKMFGDDLMRRLIRDVFAIVGHRSRSRFDQTADCAKRRGLAGTIRADQRDNTLLRHLQGNAVQGLDGAVTDFKIADLKHRRWG